MSTPTLIRDFRFACILLISAPGSAALAVLSLAISIAACTTIFSVIYTVLLSSPNFKDPNRLVVVWESNSAQGIAKSAVAPATFRDWRENSHALALELVAPGSPVTIAAPGLPERANLQYATPGLFKLLDVHPAFGRFFGDPEESNATAPLILSYGLWQRRFGGNPAAIGEKVVVNGEIHTVFGVLPPDFNLFDTDTDIWMPIAVLDANSQDRSFRGWLIAVGRLKRGETLASAQAEMGMLARRIAVAHPASNRNWTAKVEPIQEAQFGTWRGVLYPLWGAVLFVLLISCASAANLFLGRLSSRTREISIRAALGASRARLIGQLLNEGLLVGLMAGCLGFLSTGWGIQLFTALAPRYFPLVHSIQPNLTVLLFCMGTSLFSGALLAIIPAFIGTRVNLQTTLRRAAPSALGRDHTWFRNIFAALQIALSLALLLGAGLMIRSFLNVLKIDPGFKAQQIVTMQLFLSGPRYFVWTPDGVRIHDEVGNFYGQLLDRAKAVPGIQRVALVSWLPQMGYNTGRRERSFQIASAVNVRGEGRVADFNAISADYFQVLQIPLFEGRTFVRADTGNAPWVAIVNRAFARRFFPNESAIGKQVVTDDGFAERPREIVGVVGDVRQDTPENGPEPEIFVPYLQQPRVAAGHGYQNRAHKNVVVRIEGDADSAVSAIRRIAAQMDSNQPIYGVRTMARVLAETTALRRLNTTLIEMFAAIALFLSAIGVFSVISRSVSERTAEIGLRMAVGPPRRTSIVSFCWRV
jgi:putative ABC transport system permease protein